MQQGVCLSKRHHVNSHGALRPTYECVAIVSQANITVAQTSVVNNNNGCKGRQPNGLRAAEGLENVQTGVSHD